MSILLTFFRTHWGGGISVLQYERRVKAHVSASVGTRIHALSTQVGKEEAQTSRPPPSTIFRVKFRNLWRLREMLGRVTSGRCGAGAGGCRTRDKGYVYVAPGRCGAGIGGCRTRDKQIRLCGTGEMWQGDRRMQRYLTSGYVYVAPGRYGKATGECRGTWQADTCMWHREDMARRPENAEVLDKRLHVCGTGEIREGDQCATSTSQNTQRGPLLDLEGRPFT
jgi:hypothetical protein